MAPFFDKNPTAVKAKVGKALPSARADQNFTDPFGSTT